MSRSFAFLQLTMFYCFAVVRLQPQQKPIEPQLPAIRSAINPALINSMPVDDIRAIGHIGHAKYRSEEIRPIHAELLELEAAAANSPLRTRKRSVSLINKSPNFSECCANSLDEGAEKSAEARWQQQKRHVTFDPATTILDMCHYGDPVDNVALPTLRTAMGLVASTDESGSSSKPIDINTIFSPYNWLTPLHQACTHGHYHVVMLLLTEMHSCVNMPDREGWTALHCACAEGHFEILNLLSRCQGRMGEEKAVGAQPDWIYPPDGPICLNPENEDGETPEDVLLEEKAKEIREMLSGKSVKHVLLDVSTREYEEIY
jgi:hypothetical protein